MLDKRARDRDMLRPQGPVRVPGAIIQDKPPPEARSEFRGLPCGKFCWTARAGAS